MVYIRELLKHNRDKLIQNKNIELAAYLAISSPQDLASYDFELTGEEQIALQGYKNEPVEKQKVVSIVSKVPIKGINASSNIYKFAGLYLAAKEELKDGIKEKYSHCDLSQKYFLSKVEPRFTELLKKDVTDATQDSISTLIKKVLNIPVKAEELDQALSEISKLEFDVPTQILLEDLEKILLQIKYANKSTEEVVRDILNNFSNAIQKIIKDRRKDHPEFKISDEYDVQDILYVILKAIFPTLKDEDPIPKVGGKSTKIDLILREVHILVEVKMIKEKDSNETQFIEQLKIDLESYHECKWLNKLFCFVYDPYKKTRDISNFHDLNGNRTKGEHSFNVEVIVTN